MSAEYGYHSEILEPLSYYTTCSMTCDEREVETVLEGVGEYHREGNTLYLNPCHICGESMEVSGWLDECDECGELHYDVDGCGSGSIGEGE